MEIIDVMGKTLAPRINIGRRGTYQTETIVFDVSKLIEKYGVGTAVLMVKRPKDTAAYPAMTTYEDGKVYWVVTETDTAITGYGECELFWYVDNGLAKTVIFSMNILRDIGETTEEPPDPYDTWVDTLTDLGAETLANAQAAAESAEAAETAAQLLASPTATATTLPPNSEATASYSDGVFSFGIPRGADGSGGGTGDYSDLSNKPSINGNTLVGNKTAAQLGLATPSDIPSVPVQSVNGKTGTVVLNASDVGAYTKPNGGIPKTDLASAVQTSLGKADTALQSYTETDPTVPSWAKASSKPSYTASEVGAIPVSTAVTALWAGTQAEYDALTPESTVLYFIKES